jgi:hypothetical protein
MVYVLVDFKVITGAQAVVAANACGRVKETYCISWFSSMHPFCGNPTLTAYNVMFCNFPVYSLMSERPTHRDHTFNLEQAKTSGTFNRFSEKGSSWLV